MCARRAAPRVALALTQQASPSRAREMDIADLQPFFESDMFQDSFTLQRREPPEPTLLVHMLSSGEAALH